ncbi:hypothetical protein LCGC14_1257760, partial [marine sediment metagenome]
LQDDDIEVWLDNGLKESDVNKVIEDDLPDSQINTWPISKDLYKRNGEADRADITDRVDYPDLQIKY